MTPKGTWSEYEVKVVGQHYTIIRNGAVINEFDNTPGQPPPAQGIRRPTFGSSSTGSSACRTTATTT